MSYISLTNHRRLLLAFVLLSLCILVLPRVLTLLIFGDFDELALHQSEVAAMMFLGLRFDLKIVAILLLVFYWLPMVLIGWRLKPEKFHRYLSSVLVYSLVILLLLGFIELGYWLFFGGPIDVLIFGFFEDDTLAILATIFADWRLLGLTVAFITLVVCIFRLFWHQSRLSSNVTRLPKKHVVLIHFLLLLVLVSVGRGSLGSFPLRVSNASVGSNSFINSLVLGSVFNLKNAYQDRRDSGINSTTSDVLMLAKVKDIKELEFLSGYNDDKSLIKTTSLKNGRLPHVVFVLAEGWSTEIALGQSDSNQVLGELAKHIREDHFYRYFFSNAYGTNPSVEAVLLNSPITPLSQSPAVQTKFSTSNVLPFKRAGYRTIYISGGDSSWRNHEKFWPSQGFDSYVGRAAIEQHYPMMASDNPWGVYEENLFAYVQEEISKAEADGQPLFAFVMTTNNHPPVHLPKTYVAPPLDPSIYGFSATDQEKLHVLSGYHYQTDQLGKFVSWIKSGSLQDKVIVAATGDHILKGFSEYNTIARSYLRYSVPAYFYVPNDYDLLRSVPDTVVGSHQDIFPTLFELALSESDYYQFGTPLMAKNTQSDYGWVNQHSFLFSEGVVDKKTNTLYEWADVQQVLLTSQGKPPSIEQLEKIDLEKYRELLREWYILSDYEKL